MMHDAHLNPGKLQLQLSRTPAPAALSAHWRTAASMFRCAVSTSRNASGVSCFKFIPGRAGSLRGVRARPLLGRLFPVLDRCESGGLLVAGTTCEAEAAAAPWDSSAFGFALAIAEAGREPLAVGVRTAAEGDLGGAAATTGTAGNEVVEAEADLVSGDSGSTSAGGASLQVIASDITGAAFATDGSAIPARGEAREGVEGCPVVADEDEEDRHRSSNCHPLWSCAERKFWSLGLASISAGVLRTLPSSSSISSIRVVRSSSL
mmetsp:Transcript_60819/g.110922  ORF Transcript_60819/g.110922 Transcript_60819/m.110922 type:complete len:263 (+) Transcript_60819:3-791(+)